MVGAKGSVHGRPASLPAGPTLSPFHRLTLLMLMSKKEVITKAQGGGQWTIFRL